MQVSINTRVRATSESVMGDPEVQHQRHRTRLIREVTHDLHVPTSLTPDPTHLLCFYFVGCAKEVSNLINLTVVSFFGSRVSGTGCHMVTERVDGEPQAESGILKPQTERGSSVSAGVSALPGTRPAVYYKLVFLFIVNR